MEIKFILKSLTWFFIILFCSLFIFNVLYYFDIISNNTIKYLKIASLIVACFTSGFIRGITSSNKGYVNGLKISAIIVLLFLTVTIFLKQFSLKCIIYYAIIAATVTLGSMIGINKKKS